MSGATTARDRVWAAVMEQSGQFKVDNIRWEIDYEDRPSDETIRRVLRSGKELGVIKHRDGSQYYRLSDSVVGPNLSR